LNEAFWKYRLDPLRRKFFMNDASFVRLVQNAAMLVAIAFLFDETASRWRMGQSSFRQALVGIALGTIGIAVMLTPWTFVPGIVFDTRSVLLGISGLFFGSVCTVIAMVTTSAFRFYQGGTGTWTGVAVILASGTIGIAWRHLRHRPLAEISWHELYLFGIVIHLTLLGLMFTLPWATALRVLSNIALPVILIYPLGTALLGLLMVNRLRREWVEKAPRESGDRYCSHFDNSIDAILLTAQDGRILAANSEACRIFGRTEEEICRIGRTGLMDRNDPRLAASLEERARTGRFQGELTFIRKDGTSFPGEISSAIFTDFDGNSIMGKIIRDITVRKRAEEILRQAEENFRRSLDESPLGICIATAEGETLYANRAILDIYGYSSVEELITTPIQDRYTLQSCAEFKIREEERKRGHYDPSEYEISIVRKNGEVRHLQVFHKEVLWNGARQLQMIHQDITEHKNADEKLKETLGSLRKVVGTTIQVMTSAVKARDPYTAGHQIRSADLARAIATEMGLPQETIDGIRMAGSIHDIGKLSIPVEILSKPTRLTETEFSLMKEHSQSGYEILKGVESPWPLAEIAYHHHERMDGSGYPGNLKGNDILIEARIMAVADVIESMASHRPYRPALGIDAALEEIEKNKNTLYDADVVDACLRLFREKGFYWKDQTLR
jgi:PAS domain S-box-containing protein